MNIKKNGRNKPLPVLVISTFFEIKPANINKKLTSEPTNNKIPRSPAVAKIIKRIKNAKETPIQLK